MPDHEDSLGGETLDGDAQADRAEQSLGDGAPLDDYGTNPTHEPTETHRSCGGKHRLLFEATNPVGKVFSFGVFLYPLVHPETTASRFQI